MSDTPAADQPRQMTPEEAADFAEQVFNKAREGDAAMLAALTGMYLAAGAMLLLALRLGLLEHAAEVAARVRRLEAAPKLLPGVFLVQHSALDVAQQLVLVHADQRERFTGCRRAAG